MWGANESPPAQGNAEGGAGNNQYTVEIRPPFEIAQAMIDRGFMPVPIKHGTKAPYHSDWQRRRFSAGNFQFDDGVGLVLGTVVCIDIDVLDEGIASQIEALALKALAPSSCRVGLWPKRALFYSVPEPTKKAVTRSTAAGRVELLGLGQQAVVAGVHPDTGQPYRWRGAPPWSHSFELVTVTPEQVEAFRREAEALLGLPEVEAVATASTPMPAAPSIDTGTMPRAEDIARALAGYWSADDYDAWAEAGLLLKGHVEGRELWMAWSATSPKFKPAEAAEKWVSFKPDCDPVAGARKMMEKVPREVLQAWGREHRISQLATDPMVAEGARIADAIMPSRRAAPEAVDDDEHENEHPDDDEGTHGPPQGRGGAVPEHLLTVPGALQDVVTYYTETAKQDQPQFAVLAALVFGAVVLGRRWKTDQDNFASFYSIAVARTGGGKEHVRRVVYRLLTAALLEKLMGPRSYASGPAVASGIHRQPCHVAVIDEFGLVLAEARAQGSHKAGVTKELMELFGLQADTYCPTAYGHAGLTEAQIKSLEQITRSPSLTLVGLSTPSTLLAGLTGGDISSGLLNRFLVVQSHEPLREARVTRETAISPKLISWAQYHASAHAGDGNLADDFGPEQPPVPVEVPFGAEALKALKQFTKKELLPLQNRDAVTGELLVRSREIAMRISLIVARSMGQTEIGPEPMQWAIDYVRWHTWHLLEIAPRIGQTKWAQMVDELGDAIARAGGKGLTPREIGRTWHPWRGTKPQEQQALLQAVVADRGAVLKTIASRQGRARQAWVIPGRRTK